MMPPSPTSASRRRVVANSQIHDICPMLAVVLFSLAAEDRRRVHPLSLVAISPLGDPSFVRGGMGAAVGGRLGCGEVEGAAVVGGGVGTGVDVGAAVGSRLGSVLGTDVLGGNDGTDVGDTHPPRPPRLSENMQALFT